MAQALIDKLSGYSTLLPEDVALLNHACTHQKNVPARKDLVREGESPGPIFVMLQGWACRYKLLPEGTRQITAFLMPGDCFDMHSVMLNRMEHSIATITPARVAVIPRNQIDELITTRASLTRAFWWMQLVDEDTLRAWVVSIGRRNSVQRVAHLMCELHARARNIGHVDDNRLELPLTQEVLGDALGLTAVHVNRVLRKLRLAGAMRLTAGNLIISDIGKLRDMAGFEEDYLHRRPYGAA